MKKECLKTVLSVAAGLLLIGCATSKPKEVSTFNALDLNPMLKGGEYVQKVDNFIVILDKSGSMGELYKGEKKLDYAKEMVSRMNQTIPDIHATGALRVFGRLAVFSKDFTELMWGPAAYSKAGMDEGLNKVGWARGDSPLNIALDAAGEDFKSAEGDMAVIIFSDANKEYMNYDAVKKAAVSLKSRYGNRVCIYPVQIGENPEGQKLLRQVAEDGQCGFFTNAGEIASSQGMGNFVSNIFMKKLPPKPAKVEKVVEEKIVVILDSDGDGVPDSLDKCPGTPEGVDVNQFGCWVFEDVLFDFNKYNIKPQFYEYLDQAAVVFEKNPSLRVQIEGNTDNIGTAANNMKISLKRAEAVMNYLIKKGVAKDRLSAKGYGFTRPIATNETKEGRTLNRRVELTPIP